MDWNEVYGGVKRVANRTAKKLNQTADMAALQVKLTVAQGKLDEAYAVLGRVAYLHFTGDEDLSGKVALAIECVDVKKKDVRDLKQKIEAAKKKAAEEKARQKALDSVAEAAAETVVDEAEESAESAE